MPASGTPSCTIGGLAPKRLPVRPGAGGQDAACSARRMRFADTWPWTPRPCANWLTRSSWSIQRDLARGARLGAVRRLELVDRAQLVAVGGDGVGQAVQAPRRGAQVALDVGQPPGAGGGDEAREDEAAELRATSRRAGCSAGSAPIASRRCAARARRRARRRPASDHGRPRRQPRGDVLAQRRRSRRRPRPGRRPRRRARRASRRAGRRAPPSCGAPASVSAGARAQAALHAAQRRGQRQQQQAARPGAHRAGAAAGVSSARTPTVAPSSTSAG